MQPAAVTSSAPVAFQNRSWITNMKLVKVLDLVGTDIAGLRADIRTRLADGSLMYGEQPEQREPIMVTMKCAEIKRQIRRGETYHALYWRWDGYSCGYSGVPVDRAEQYHFMMEVAA